MRFLKDSSFIEQGLTPIRDTDVYTVTDNEFLDNLTVSETVLYPNQQTGGHKHDDLDEVYIFLEGSGTMMIDEHLSNVTKGDIVHVKGGEFHKVFNITSENLRFIAIFQKYTREH